MHDKKEAENDAYIVHQISTKLELIPKLQKVTEQKSTEGCRALQDAVDDKSHYSKRNCRGAKTEFFVELDVTKEVTQCNDTLDQYGKDSRKNTVEINLLMIRWFGQI